MNAFHRIAQAFKLQDTVASKEGRYYRAANDSKIAIHGMKQVYGITQEGQKIGMDMQIADVKKPLGSVRRICESGNRVVFDEAGSYIEHKKSGNRTDIAKEGSTYVVRVWLPGKGGNTGFRRQATR